MTSRRTTPSTGGLSNPAFKYVPAADTNIAARFKAMTQPSKTAPAKVSSISSAIRGKANG